MRLSLLCVWTNWILTLHTVAQHHPHREEGDVQPGHREGVQTGWRRQSLGRPTPLQPDANKPAAVKEPEEKVRGGQASGRRRAPLTGPHVCGGQCCVGWTLTPRTRRCTKPRCFPRCHNGALCRQSNRCVCRQGFHGPRCEFSTVTFSVLERPLTSLQPTIIPHRPPVQFNPPHNPPGPTTTPKRTTRPVQCHVMAACSGPAAIFPLFASTRAATTKITSKAAILNAKPGASDLDPSTPAETHNREEDAKIPISGSAKCRLKTEGVQKRFPLPEENQASLKSKEVKMKITAEEALTKAGSKSGTCTRDTEAKEEGAQITEKTPTLKSDPEPEAEEALHSNSETRFASFKTSSVESHPQTEIQEGADPGSLTENQNLESLSGSETEERSMTADESVIRQSGSAKRSTAYTVPNLRPEAERGGSLMSRSGSGSKEEQTSSSSESEEREGVFKISQVKFYSGSKVENQRRASSKIPDLGSDQVLRGERTVDPAETRRKEVERLKSGGAKKQLLSLQEAQAVLLRKTLSRGGRGDKMATLLMKHIEKERKKLRTRGQYTVHVTVPSVTR
ncbi:uncharacterized protein LOC111663386 [Seriola lalandi dorsalis]|uniref:uncharacterized protein LOC111663386 n=1 Tax=Seriola lalandi dorsalis TaxID=1841481 RepID=UPI000C6F99F1|nr:uncharacterized protein LOC111663386 [Seriola lalandi dorsalis]